MDRREFLKKTAFIGGALGMGFLAGKNSGNGSLFAQDMTNYPDLAAIKGGEPDIMFDKGIEAMGGMSRFVKKGQTVLVKPNIGWNRTPEYGANTNPKLVKRIIEHCLNAGAKKVYVFDNTCNEWQACYKNSGIEQAVNDANAQMVPGNSESYYQSVKIKGSSLYTAKVHELILSSDVFINVPVLKHHSGATLTMAMKNLMGVVWDRGFYHSNDLHQCIADFCLFKRPHLNILDAYTLMRKNGPRARSMEDVEIIKNQLISTDIVAIDAAGAKLFGVDPKSIPHIKYAYAKKLGNMNLDELKIKKIVI